ncbi:hypothetical protein D3C73_1163820 [compost metagenome]
MTNRVWWTAIQVPSFPSSTKALITPAICRVILRASSSEKSRIFHSRSSISTIAAAAPFCSKGVRMLFRCGSAESGDASSNQRSSSSLFTRDRASLKERSCSLSCSILAQRVPSISYKSLS